jgi:hypothetical protein
MILAIPSSYRGVGWSLASRQDDEVMAITESVFAYSMQLSSRKYQDNRDGAITFQHACALGCGICLSDSAPRRIGREVHITKSAKETLARHGMRQLSQEFP